MNRYNTPLWAELEALQNSEANQNVDILTITGFMNDEQLEAHVESYRTIN